MIKAMKLLEGNRKKYDKKNPAARGCTVECWKPSPGTRRWQLREGPEGEGLSKNTRVRSLSFAKGLPLFRMNNPPLESSFRRRTVSSRTSKRLCRKNCLRLPAIS